VKGGSSAGPARTLDGLTNMGEAFQAAVTGGRGGGPTGRPPRTGRLGPADRLQRLVSEEELRRWCLEVAQLMGWLYHHQRPGVYAQGGRRADQIEGDRGFPLAADLAGEAGGLPGGGDVPLAPVRPPADRAHTGPMTAEAAGVEVWVWDEGRRARGEPAETLAEWRARRASPYEPADGLVVLEGVYPLDGSRLLPDDRGEWAYCVTCARFWRARSRPRSTLFVREGDAGWVEIPGAEILSGELR
jgi:hypothetical protein